MKLFTKYNRINIASTIMIFLLAGIAYYFAIRFIFISRVDEDLRIEQREIESYVNEHIALPEPVQIKDQQIVYQPAFTNAKQKFETVRLNDHSSGEIKPFRQLQFSIAVKKQLYLVTVDKSLTGTDDVIESILLITMLTIICILAASLIINRILLKSLWTPFYESLNKIRQFNIGQKDKLLFPATRIEEFDAMNDVLNNMTCQVQQDYLTLKEFTENASHEIQTPLAIIRSKLDLLIQDEHLSEKQGRIVQSTYEAIEKLSRLNTSLLLLVKIENNQYADTSSFNMAENIREKCIAFSELWQNRDITIHCTLNDVEIKMNQQLADILLNNLFSNATRYNHANGFISIHLDSEKLEVANSSKDGELNKEMLFSRFNKPSNGQHQNGLGLSIIRQITEVSDFDLQYHFTRNRHIFNVKW